MYKNHQKKRSLEVIQELKRLGENEKAESLSKIIEVPKHIPKSIYKNRYERFEP